MTRAIATAFLLVLAGCPRTGPIGPSPTPIDAGADAVGEPPPDAGSPDAGPPDAPPPQITWRHVDAPGDVPSTPPPAGTWRIHLIDVGTGLAILVQGADFTLLYDAGTGDPQEKPLRAVAYLAAVLGAGGDAQCGTPGTGRRHLDHVVLSHPHLDHASALELVLHCFEVGQIWDSGRVNDTVFYRDFLRGVSEAIGTRYHTASPPPADRTIVVKGEAITLPSEVGWDSFSEGDQVALGQRARFTLLHAEAKRTSDPNGNSIVLAVELGGARLLLTGDAESGPRADPSAKLGDVEAHLVDHFAPEIDADILQVGHHGSKTSTRAGFLTAVSPTLALISAGPKRYGSVRLPDKEILDLLAAAGIPTLRTDLHDDACAVAVRLGPATGPGGCDSWIITVAQPE